MKRLLMSGLLLAAPLSWAQEAPNVIVFLVDDMGVMDTSLPFMTDRKGRAVRHPLNDWYHTPNMERMARQGIRFSTFYAQSVSSPSRASILTGQNATRHRTTNWINSESNNRTPYGPQQWNWNGLSAQGVTLPRVLQSAGYRTIHVGKAHFGPIGSAGEDPQRVGFDVNVAGSSIGQPGSYYGEHGYGHLQGNKRRAVPGLQKYHGTATFLTEALTLEAKEQMSRAVKEKKPFFLYMAHYALHAPFEADKRFATRYQYGEKGQAAAAFATLVEGMDKSLGDLMDHLEQLGVAENTLILFLGDNGSDAPLGDEKGYSSSAPLRGKKGTEYEGGVRIPFIACWGKPDASNRFQRQMPIRMGAVQQQYGTVMDIYPTVLSLAQVANPAGHAVDGVDLSVQFTGKPNRQRSGRILMHFPHEHRGSYFTTFIEGDWKLIYYYNPDTPDRPAYRLYHLKRDPAEQNDLSLVYPKRVARLVEAMSAQLASEGALYPEDGQGRPLLPFYRAEY